ncbi:substrate-binding domain-containing protein [Actinomarinicola tropica]|uniref:substrate-binding domain-containing protein n=1 Tax=Actinomarinicola tropica TaxID=2789776 RepID=UPI00189B9F79|nr:substrate-binding domain-containing protein [Actinomarinicola tropica]
MSHSKSRITWLIALFAVFTLVAAACGDDDGDDTSNGGAGEETGGGDAGGEEAGGDLSGSVVVSGSSTVEPISVAVAEKFNGENPDVDIPVDGPGTGDGFELFCQGETAINDASSKVKDAQIEQCEENGIEFIELWIGNDGLSIMTNEANDALSCVSLEDIYALVGPESQGFDNWSDAQDLATELGSDTELPDAPLDVTGPGEESGTFASFVEIVIEEFNEDRGQDATTRPDYQSSADDNVIIQGIQGSDTSFGWVGFAFAREAQGVKILEVDGGDGCVAPTDETVADGSYPIARPLFIYVNAQMAEENPALAAFVDYYLSDEGIASVGEVGYVPLADEDLEATRSLWEARTTGAQ